MIPLTIVRIYPPEPKSQPYRSGPRIQHTLVDVGVPDPRRDRSLVAIGVFALLLVAGVFVASPNASTAVTFLGMGGLAALAWWAVRRLERHVKKDVRARILIDHFQLHADIDVVGTATVTKTRLELNANTTFSLDEVHGEQGKQLALRVREGGEVRLDIATYALDEAEAAQPALKRLETTLTALRPTIEERDERRLRR